MPTFSPLYEIGLREFLQTKQPEKDQPAGERKFGASLARTAQLGRMALSHGLAIVEVAHVHERAVFNLELTDDQAARSKRAEAFFTEVIAPIVATDRITRENRRDRDRLDGPIGKRTAALATANRLQESSVIRHRGMVQALTASCEGHALLLQESLRLQEDFRRLTHQALAALVAERLEISRELNDEGAQTLLGIHARLVSLNHKARSSACGLKAEIASMQKLAIRSAKSVRLVARRVVNT